eukprot:gene3252-3733_t
MNRFQKLGVFLAGVLYFACVQCYPPPKPQVTKEVTGIDPNDVIVECYPDGLRVVIEKSKFKRITSSDQLHFSDPACYGAENSTHFIASTPYRSCGVSKSVKWNGIVYSNTLMTGYTEMENYVETCPVVSIKFSCMFSHFQFPKPRYSRAASKEIQCEHLVALGPRIRNGVIRTLKAKSTKIRMKSRVMTCPSLVGLGPQLVDGVLARVTVKAPKAFRARTETILCKPMKSTGIHSLELKAYKDPGFTDEIKDVLVLTSPDAVDIYYEMKIKTSDSFLTISPSRCYATPNKDPKHTVQYEFIKNGCTGDETIQFYQSPSRAVFRFSIKSFRFRGFPDAMFFVHCDAAICDAEDKESICAKGCETNKSRKKRSRPVPRRRINTGFNKRCLYDTMQVAIERDMLRGANPSLLQLDDPSCIASQNRTHFFMNIKKGTCGTLSITRGQSVEISNTVYYRVDGIDIFSMPLKCEYKKRVGSSTSRSFYIANHRRFVSVTISKSYYVNKKVVFDSTFSDVFDQTPLDIQVNEVNGNLDIHVKPVSPTFSFVVDHCKVKPKLTSRTKVVLIENDCVKSERQVFMRRTPDSSRIFVDYRKWAINRNKVFVKCHFTVCHKNVPSSKCHLRSCSPPGLPVRDRRSIDYDKLKASVSCSPKLITIAIDKSSAPSLKSSDLHLRTEQCKPSENSTHIIFHTKPYECRTSFKSIGSSIEYSNIILQKEKEQHAMISRNSPFELAFKCIFAPRVRKISGFKAKKTFVKFSGISSGTYGVRLMLFSDATFNRQMDSANARFNPGSNMFFQVSIDTPNIKLVLYLELCYGRPLFASHDNERYTFIKDNCAVDETVKFYDSADLNSRRFSVSPFEFSNQIHKSVYINCIVSACDPNDSNSRCFRKCPKVPTPF